MTEHFSVCPGVTCTAWEQALFDAELIKLRGADSRYPLTFAEFHRLIRSGFLCAKPEETDPTLYENDPVLFLTDDALLRQSIGSIDPKNIRYLRRKYLFKIAKENYYLNSAKDEKILEYIRPKLVGNSANHTDFIDYLETFHLKDISSFFSLRPFPFHLDDLKAHAYIAAGSGHGKTELMKSIMHEVMRLGHGVILLDPHGDLAEQVGSWKEFVKQPERLFYFDARLNNLDSYPVINPLDPIQKAPPELLDSTIETFLSTIPAVIGADGELSSRMKTILKPCLYTLSQYPNSTLHDLLDFISEKENTPNGWIEKARKRLTNRAQLNTLDAFFESGYKITKGAVADRLRTLLSSDTLDHCLAGVNSVDLPGLMDSGKFCIFNLSAGRLGEDTSPAFGRLILCAIQGAAMRRQEQKAHERKPVFMFIDEADRFISPAVVSIYKETRKYGLHLCLVQQITGFNMESDVFRAIIGNSRVKFAGASGDDTTVKDLHKMTGVEGEEIKKLRPLHFYIKSVKDAPVKFKINENLLGDRNKMTNDEWDEIKKYQIKHYYNIRSDSIKTPSHTNKPTDDLDPIIFK